MADKETVVFTGNKCKNESENSVAVVSPRKIARKHRGRNRREAIQASLLLLNLDRIKEEQRNETVIRDTGGINNPNPDLTSELDENTQKKTTSKTPSRMSDINKSTSLESKNDNGDTVETRKRRRKSNIKKDNSSSGIKVNMGKTQSVDEMSKTTDTDDSLERHVSHCKTEASLTGHKKKASEKLAANMSIASDNNYVTELNTDKTEKLTTPVSKRKKRPPNKLSTDGDITSVFGAECTLQNNRLKGDDSLTNEVMQENDLVVKSETKVQDDLNSSITPDCQSRRSKRKGKPNKILVSSSDTAVDDTKDNSVKEINNLTIKSEQTNLEEEPGNQVLKTKRKNISRKLSASSLDDSINNSFSGKQKKGSSMKKDSDSYVLESTPRSGRKRKRINYSALSKGEDSGNDDDTDIDDYDISPVAKKRSTKSKVAEDINADVTDIEDKTPQRKKLQTVKSEETKSERKGKAKQIKKELQCSRCDENFSAKSGITRHMAIKHQALWTEENPEGLDDHRSLNQVIKIKKFLNCPKCGKQLNFLQYYKQHLEWCGRETETFTCPICGHEGLLAKWRDMHIRTCQRNHTQQEEAAKRGKILQQLEKEDKEGAKDGMKKKRRAAKMATTMLHNLTQDKEAKDDLYDDTDDEDFQANQSDDEEVPEEYEEDEEEPEEEEFKGSEEESDLDVNLSFTIKPQRRCCTSADGHKYNPFYGRYYITYLRMKKLVKEHMSLPLYTDLVPGKEEWIPVKESGCEQYLPVSCDSIEFKFTSTSDQLQRLKLYDSVFVQGLPLFFTGLSVWKMAWCPTDGNEQATQYLAVVGKTDHESHFRTNTRLAAPGHIQIWDTGITSNIEEPDGLPRLMYNIIHDYGVATDIKWCPSGCWQAEKSETDENPSILSRLGLLACSFTDSTVRIFSIPHIAYSGTDSDRAYKPSPVLTLVPQKSWQSYDVTCSSLDWQSLHGHTQIVAGYSDGIVRVYNLLTKSSLQIMEPSPHKVLLPYHSFQAHAGLVYSCAWMYSLEDWVITVGEDSSTHFWDLKDTSQPLNSENSSYMPVRVINNLMFPGAVTSSDDNYSVNTNKTRYIEAACLPRLEETRSTVYMTSQSACIWDITYSNWLNFVLACDSRGTVEGTPLYDLTTFETDTKTYVQRLKIFEAKVKLKQSQESPVADEIQCQCKNDQAESCSKCKSLSETVCDSKSKHLSQRDTDIQPKKLLKREKTDSQSKNPKQKTESASGQSVNFTQTTKEKLQKDPSRQKENISDEKNTKSKHTMSVLQLQSIRSEDKQRKEPKTYSEIIEKTYLEFSEYLSPKTRKKGPTVDTDFDVYDRYFISALHSMSVFNPRDDHAERNQGYAKVPLSTVIPRIVFNPNKHCCFWVAYGGDAGLVRVVNIKDMLPGKFTQFYQSR